MLSEDLSQLSKNYLIQTCAHCKKKMQLSEGDIIYGNKWYHKDCFITWNQVRSHNALEEA